VTLPDSFLQSLIRRLDNPNVVALSFAGSFARGQAGPHSDVDLQVYVRELPESRYDLRLWDDYLVSLAYKTIEEERDSLSHPKRAIWCVPGLRQAVILLDKDGTLARIKQAAQTFDWSALQAKADEYAVDELMGCAKEVRKILNGLLRSEESTVLYALLGLTLGMCSAVAVQRGLLIETENRYFDIVQDSVGRDSNWTRAFRLALGADPVPVNVPHFQARGRAGLALYCETSLLFQAITTGEHREVIEATINRIENAGY
jgi:predicted nucleotidyltransferase